MHSFFFLPIAALLALLTAACATPTRRIEAEAQRAGFERTVVQGSSFRHAVFWRAATGDAATLTVFLEGDGLPWMAGRAPAADPTPRDPLALHLATQTAGPVMYVSRPCYHELADAMCSARSWTFDRYSAATIDSMTAAIATHARSMQSRTVRLVGYSGGGVLAILIAERLPNVSAVVTIAANLDTDAWVSHHGYLPLDGSLNPASSVQTHPWKELHLQGTRDETVPSATTRAYFERFPNAQRVAFDGYDHVCCWLRDWTDVTRRIEAELD